MAVKTLSQIVNELNTTYQPQIKSLQEQQALIPGQIAEQQKGLEAQQAKSFNDILGGARSRGLGFSGIPLQEQAQYTSTQFLPALANLRQQGNQQRLSLQDAILGINERRDTTAQSLYQQYQDRAEQQRQFNLNLALQKAQLAEQRRQADMQARASAASAASAFSPSYGFSGGTVASAPKTPQWQQVAYNDVKTRVDSAKNINELKSDFNATYSSAIRGNRTDQAKIILYQKMRPDLFSPNKLFQGPSAGSVIKAFNNNVKSWGIKL